MGSNFIAIDEPTVGQDMNGRKMLSIFLKDLKRDRKGILVATHDIEWIAALADRVIILRRDKNPLITTFLEIFEKPSILKENGIHIPQIVEFAHKIGLTVFSVRYWCG